MYATCLARRAKRHLRLGLLGAICACGAPASDDASNGDVAALSATAAAAVPFGADGGSLAMDRVVVGSRSGTSDLSASYRGRYDGANCGGDAAPITGTSVTSALLGGTTVPLP